MARSTTVLNAKKVYKSLQSDFNLNMGKLQKVKAYYIDGEDGEIKDIIHFVLIKKKMKFEQLPAFLKNTIVRYVDDNVVGEFTELLIKKKLIPYNYLPLDSAELSSMVLEKGCRNEEERNFLRVRLGWYHSLHYRDYDEKKCIRLLGKKYSECKTIEDVLKKMYQLELTRDSMSMLEMFALTIYVAKTLSKNNLSGDISLHNVDREMRVLGSSYKRSVVLHINGGDNKFIDMINALHHEISHAIQDKHMKEGKLSADQDVDLYIKDKILRSILGQSYYTSNYNSISYEFDAEVKARMMTAKLLDLVKINYNHKGNWNVVDKNATKVVEHSIQKTLKSGFDHDISREYSDIYSLFEEEMNKLIVNNPGMYEDILEEHKFLKYEYVCSKKKFRIKSIKELIVSMDEAKTKKEKGIYFNILKSRINENKMGDDAWRYLDEIYDEYEENIHKYKMDTRKILRYLCSMSVCRDDNNKVKYKGHFNRMGGNKR